MAKIQLVVEIDERLYKNIIDNDKDDEEFEAMDMAFCNAKPLPKGHGDLKDADRLVDSFYEYCKNGEFGYHEELITGLRHIAHTMERNGHSYYHHIAEDAIQALEQQPFINKPCISEGVCREDKIQVLDKIRTEIKTMSGDIETIADVLKIIDKYKAESEVQDVDA